MATNWLLELSSSSFCSSTFCCYVIKDKKPHFSFTESICSLLAWNGMLRVWSFPHTWIVLPQNSVGLKKACNLPMPMPTCPMGIFEYSFPWSMPSSLIQRRSWHWRKVFRGFSAHSVSPRLARTIANEVFVENFNCAITLVMGLVMVVVALLVFSIGYGVHCDCHVDCRWSWHWSDPCNWIFPSCDRHLVVTWVHPPY